MRLKRRLIICQVEVFDCTDFTKNCFDLIKNCFNFIKNCTLRQQVSESSAEDKVQNSWAWLVKTNDVVS